MTSQAPLVLNSPGTDVDPQANVSAAEVQTNHQRETKFTKLAC